MRSRILLRRSNLRYYAIWIGIAVFSIALSQIGDLRLRRANERGAEDAAGANAGRAAGDTSRASSPAREGRVGTAMTRKRPKRPDDSSAPTPRRARS